MSSIAKTFTALKNLPAELILKTNKTDLLVVLKVFLISAAFCMTIILGGYFNGIGVGRFTHDIHHLSGLPYYTGIISNTGIVIWTSASAICLFTYLLLKRSGKTGISVSFILNGFWLTTLLMLDDLIMLHEYVIPGYFGIHEVFFFILYGFLAFRFLYLHKNFILLTNFIYLLAAFAGLGFSLFIDLVPFYIPARLVFEDVPKFIGICFWLVYFADSGLNLLAPKKALSDPT